MAARWRTAVVTAIAVGLLATACTADPPQDPTRVGPSALSTTLAGIDGAPRYASSGWGYIAIDQATGEVLAAHQPDKMFDPGSTMKSFAVTTALDGYGADHRFTTPVYKTGAIVSGVLQGDLVLVGAGDLTLGLRRTGDDRLSYVDQPAIDHSYAMIGVPGAALPSGDPLAVLDGFAQQIAAAGISSVAGDVIVDDRMFQSIAWPDGLVSPIWVNENLLDIQVAAGAAAGAAATIDWRPRTAAYTVESQVTTVAASAETSLTVTEPSAGRIVVTGQIAAGSDPRLVTHEIADPAAFARTALIEALGRSGVSVSAPTTGADPAGRLPAPGGYNAQDRVASYESAPLSAYADLIMKISYNRAADLMTCLSAVAAGSTDCRQGLAEQLAHAQKLGVDPAAVFAFDGAGGDDHNRTSPRALATLYRGAASQPYASVFADSLPILGVDGSLANVLADTPAAGTARMKTGNRGVTTPAGQGILLGNSLAGYVEAASGRSLIVAIAMDNLPFSTIDEFLTVTNDQAQMVAAIRDAF